MGVISWIVVGGIIGLIAGWLLPGRNPMGCIGTVFIGVAGGVIGGELWRRYINPNNDGIAWIGAIIVAMILLAILRTSMGGGRPR